MAQEKKETAPDIGEQRCTSGPPEGEEQEKEECERPQNWQKSGYCECCQLTYTNLSEHLVSEKHCVFALNATNYRVIDEIASQIACDLIPLPHGFKPIEEQREAPPQSAEEPHVTEDEGLGKNVQGESIKEPMDLNAEFPTEKHNLFSLEPLDVTQDEACFKEKNNLVLSMEPPEQKLAIDLAQAPAGGLPENVEDDGLQCTESISNAMVQCDLPLVDPGEASHVGLVTEVSWYTEEAGLTSVYTVQSLVIPPAHILNQHPELAMDKASVQPPLFPDALAPVGSSNGLVQGDPITTSYIEQTILNAPAQQTIKLLPDEAQATTSAGAYAEPPSPPAPGSEVILHHLDSAPGPDRPLAESVGDGHEYKQKVNACEVQTEVHDKVCMDQMALAPWHPAAEDTVTSSAPVGELETMCGGKRKHCWTPCHPPAKRQPSDCQPMPMWVFHQLPSTMNPPAIPVFSDRMDRDPSNKAAEGGGIPPLLCFNPKLAQYDVSSEPDWDFQLVPQGHSNSQQTVHVGELRNAQVSLDGSWYSKQLCSVLSHEQTLGSPNTTQTVSLSHVSYDVYLSGVAS
ncbi:hypothetical protein GDO81_013317 [Engystomops pustulosus]|uniref:DBF4-type domain-containing protein n=1 Tax=Engystomops pustulosus TaxID=76066 RepID=A0AAV7B3R4_ENGPU|nr:hypothetical protein GDO81_013317 [Engystomops pustulosus]